MNQTPRKNLGTASNERSRERGSVSSTDPAHEMRHAISDRVLRDPEITRDAVVLRAELRGFAQIAEQHAAGDLTPLLDEYLNLLTQAVAETGGDIYQVDGNSLTAGFGVRAQKLNGSAERAGCGRPIAGRVAAVCFGHDIRVTEPAERGDESGTEDGVIRFFVRMRVPTEPFENRMEFGRPISRDSRLRRCVALIAVVEVC